MAIDLEIDLDDGLPPAKVETVVRSKVSEAKPLRFAAPEKIEIIRTPMALAISVAPIECLGCGLAHNDHRGIFLESKLSNGVRELKHLSLREAGPYLTLPRRIDIAPKEVVPVCISCWKDDTAFAEAVFAAGGRVNFGEPGQPVAADSVLEQIEEVEQSDKVQLVEILEEEDPPTEAGALIAQEREQSEQ